MPTVHLANNQADSLEREVIQIWSKRQLMALDQHGILCQPHRGNYNVVFFITSESAMHEIDGETLILKQGELLFFGKHTVHQFVAESDWEGIVIALNDTYLFNDLNQQSRSHVDGLFQQHRVVGAQPEYADMVQLMKALSQREHIELPVIKHLLVSLCLLICEQSQTTKMSTNHTYSSFVEALKSGSELRSINHIAQELNVSLYKLRKICLACAGKTPKQLRDEQLIVEAIRQLKYSDTPIQRIAEHFGFNEATNFSKFVKSKTGSTPNEIRRSGPDIKLIQQIASKRKSAETSPS